MKKLLSLMLTFAAVLSLAACGAAETPSSPQTPETTAEEPSAGAEPEEPEYVYKDAVSSLSADWNPHRVTGAEEAYPLRYITAGLYRIAPEDAGEAAAGKETDKAEPETDEAVPETDEAEQETGAEEPESDEAEAAAGTGAYGETLPAGCTLLPEMAAALPEDVTAVVKALHPEFGIPEEAAEGYAFRIALDPEAAWQDGTPIDADTYVESMKRLLDPKLMNARACDYWEGSLCLAGAEAYAFGGSSRMLTNSPDGTTLACQPEDMEKGADGVYVTKEGFPLAIGLDENGYGWLGGNSLRDYYRFGYIPGEVFEVLENAADDSGYVPLTDEIRTVFGGFIGSDEWGGETEDEIAYYLSFRKTYPEADFSSVGILKTGDKEITLVLDRPVSLSGLALALCRSWIVETSVYDACLSEEDGVLSSKYGTSPETSPSCGPYVMTEYVPGEYMRFARNDGWYGWTDGEHSYTDPRDGKTLPVYQATAVFVREEAEAKARRDLFRKGELMNCLFSEEELERFTGGDHPEEAYPVSAGEETLLMLLSPQASYPFGGYDRARGEDGAAYLRYHYSEAEWEAYLASCGGEIKY